MTWKVSEKKFEKIVNPDRFNWSTKKTAIDETPRFLRLGDVVTIVYCEIEEIEQEGKFGKQKLQKLTIKDNNGGKGYILVNGRQFSEIAQKFMEAGFPSEIAYVRRK